LTCSGIEAGIADGNFYYLRARYYDPAIGRFPTQDRLPGLLLETQTHNRYTYAVNNPVNLVDPRRLLSEGGPIPKSEQCDRAQLTVGALLIYTGLLIAVPGVVALLNPATVGAGIFLLEFVEAPILFASLALIIESGCVT